jgi:hypothetical protein
MHPHTFYSSLFETEKRDEVFVIIPFTDEFLPRWEGVIEPCIREDLGLQAIRVDERQSGESVVHDILEGIAHSRLVLVDITSKPLWNRDPTRPTHRSGNVMWELGVAHVIRLPDEVIVVKSDDEPTIFDLTQFRAFTYDPRDPIEARRIIADLARDRLRTISRTATDHVRNVASRVGADAIGLFFEALSKPAGMEHGVKHELGVVAPLPRTAAIVRLVEFGVLRMRMTPERGDHLKPGQIAATALYELTAFGKQVFWHLLREMGFTEQQVEDMKTLRAEFVPTER